MHADENAPPPGLPPWASLSYPLQPACLTTLVAMAVMMPLTLAPLAGFLVQLAIWAAALHYAVEVFTRTAHGTADAPEFVLEHDGIGWRLLALQLAFAACHWLLQGFVAGALPRAAGIVLIALLQPAMTLTAAMNRNVSSALQPARLLRVIAALGAAYLLLVLAGVGMGAMQEFTGRVIAGGRSYILTVIGGIGSGDRAQVAAMFGGSGILAVLAQILAGFAWCFGLVAWFHAMGALVHARARALGFEPAPQRRLRPEDRHAPLLARVDALVACGELAPAARVLGECLATQPHASMAMHARYRDLLRRIGDTAGLLEHARARIDALLAGGQPREAIALTHEALAIDPHFRPGSAEHTTALAQAAEAGGQAELTLTLLRDFPRRHPRDPAIPDHALACARLLLDRHGDPAGARAALQAALDRMAPAHPRHAELLQRLAEVDRLARDVDARSPPKNG